MPVRMFISVDLPAPFSPSSAWISPRRTSRSTSALAMTPGKYLAIPRNSTIGGVPGPPMSCGCSALSTFGGGADVLLGQALHALNRPVPVVEVHLGHGLAGRELHLALGVLELADERIETAHDLGSNSVSLLLHVHRDLLAPFVAVDTAAHGQQRAAAIPGAGEALASLLDVVRFPVEHDRADVGIGAVAANIGVPHRRGNAAALGDLQIGRLVHDAEQKIAAVIEERG